MLLYNLHECTFNQNVIWSQFVTYLVFLKSCQGNIYFSSSQRKKTCTERDSGAGVFVKSSGKNWNKIKQWLEITTTRFECSDWTISFSYSIHQNLILIKRSHYLVIDITYGSWCSVLIQRRIQNPVEHLWWNIYTIIVNNFLAVYFSQKHSIIDVRLGSEYSSVILITSAL